MMYSNRIQYRGLLDGWKTDVIAARAHRVGLRGEAMQDAFQEVVRNLQSFQYDPAKSNGACERTYFTRWVDFKLANIKRREDRYDERQKRCAEMRTASYEPKSELICDVRDAIEALPSVERQVCKLLSEGHTLFEIPEILKCSPATVAYALKTIRMHFMLLGLDEHLLEK